MAGGGGGRGEEVPLFSPRSLTPLNVFAYTIILQISSHFSLIVLFLSPGRRSWIAPMVWATNLTGVLPGTEDRAFP